MADFQVKALYDFDAQPGSGELSIAVNEVLTVTRQDVGEGWWEGTNSRGETGIFPAGYVEVMNSPPPPAMPPPPPPDNVQFTSSLNHQQSTETDDWDDEWEDDDSVYSQDQSSVPPSNLPVHTASRDVKTVDISNRTQEAKGTVRKSFNRFSTFVKSGGEAFILGQTKMAVPSEKCVTILEEGGEIMWEPNPNPYTCVISSPKKESKLGGLKHFIAYRVTPSIWNRGACWSPTYKWLKALKELFFNNIVVSRRYKHFDWLHERLEEKFSLIPIPPLPDKQISGRYQDEFIEHRMNQLQMWVNRICRHPVLSQCDVWKHFLTCTEEKRWKTGKRNAEKDKFSGGSFFHAICSPPALLESPHVERKIDNFSRFVVKMEDSVNKLFVVSLDQQKRYSGTYKKELGKLSEAFRDLGTAFQMDSSTYSEPLTAAIKHTGETFEELGNMYEQQPKYDIEPMADVLHEYKGMLSAWPDVLNIQKSALAKTSEHKKLSEEGKISSNDLAAISHRSDVISYASLAEINHFQQDRVAYFKTMMETYLTAQINFYERITEKLQGTLSMYQNS